MNTPLKEKLLELLDHLNHGLVERDSTLKAALLTMLAGENLLLVGPPGTAKSLIARKVAECLAHDGDAEHAGGYFEYLLTKFSTPEEIFGPLSISELKADRFKRNTGGYLPSVRIAFLDEIFKASSSILNALLTILNERLYHNGAEAQKVPLQALIAASNELPTGQEELDALYDRFLVRSFVDYVSEENLPRLLEKPGPASTITPLSAADLAAIRLAAETVTLPADVVSAIQKIWAAHKRLFKEDRRENLSDRRLKKAVGLLRIAATTNGRKDVDLSDLLLLKDCLWNHPDNALKVRELVMNTLRAFSPPLQLSDSVLQPLLENTAKQQKEAAVTSVAKMSAVLTGYKGSGTERDPILIETLQDLAGLERPEVGQKGYWFRQVADIDCQKLTTWLKIDFQGHYDGCGFSIDYEGGEEICLFGRVNEASHLSNLRLNGLGLAETVNCSEIVACKTDKQLIGTASECAINSCESGSAFIMMDAIKCSISYCQSADVLVGSTAIECSIRICQANTKLIFDSASACTIQDCHVQSSAEGFGIARTLNKNTVVERCVVSGKLSEIRSVESSYFGRSLANLTSAGIADNCLSSTIRQCALGTLKFRLRNRRIAGKVKTSKLENNVALDCHAGESDAYGPDGKSLSAALFTQHYFEHSLGWDFTSVWQWDDAKSQPELCAVGVGAAQQQQRFAEFQEDIGDLLQQQIRANFWL